MELFELLTCAVALVFTDATGESILTGGLISFLGAALFTWAGGYQRMEREGVLTLGGPYRFVRHPWILARFLMVFGVILMARLPWLFLVAMVGLAPLYRRLSREEDRWVYMQIGPAAAEYRAFVAAFIPQFNPAKLTIYDRKVAADHFSWRRALWKRPGRGGLALFGVGVTIVSMAVWGQRWFPVWAWRVGAVVATFVALSWIIRDRRLRRKVGSTG